MRRHPALSFDELPKAIREIGKILGAEKCEKNRKLYFACTESQNHRGVLIYNFNAQFWVHYFRCGIGLVSILCFSQIASAGGSVLPLKSRTVADFYQYQWFAHDLDSSFFTGNLSKMTVTKLGSYFIKRINPTLAYPYSICFENIGTKEPYKFVSGSFERLKEVLMWARFVCEGLKREKEPKGRTWVSPHVTITCGNFKSEPVFEHSTETFINAVGALAVKENASYTVLRDGFRRCAGGEGFDSVRKNKHRIFLNLEDENKDVPVREKIAARNYLVDWLREQGIEGVRIIKMWNLVG